MPSTRNNPLSLLVRCATAADAVAINRIYNHYVLHSTITFDLAPWSTQQRVDWLCEFTTSDRPYHTLVAESQGEVLGFAYNRQFRARAAYQLSTETTIYTAPQNRLHGIGSALYRELFQRLAQSNLHRAYAVIVLPNAHSVRFHQKFGFQQIGILSQVGYKFAQHIDTAWFEKKLPA